LFKKYIQLTKPGIIMGNIITAIAGFLLASRHHFDPLLMVAMLLGTSLVIGSACVFNNVMDRKIDKSMARTKKRAMVQGTVAPLAAMIYGVCLGLVGFAILLRYTNILVVLIGLGAMIDYVVAYGYWKRRSVYGTLVGSLSGSAPIAAGYVAARGSIDLGAVILFVILTIWQMPHFYAIAMRRLGDYKSAGVPVLPIVSGLRTTKIQIMCYIVAFIIAVSATTIFGYTGFVYLVVVVGAGLAWLIIGARGFKATNDTDWARKMFLMSLVVLMIFSVMLPLGALLP
jgi:protoheme IX farnesyltransferase